MAKRDQILIRPEREADRRKVEELTREAFWNVNVPGCDEHFLVHQLRDHEDFIPELNFVAGIGDTLVAISCTAGRRSRVRTAANTRSSPSAL